MIERIAGGVPHRVVDVLEAVDVDIGDDHAAIVARLDQAIELLLQVLDEMVPVRQTRQRIVQRLVARLLFAVRQIARSALQAVDHQPRQPARAEHAQHHQRQNEQQQRTGPADAASSSG